MCMRIRLQVDRHLQCDIYPNLLRRLVGQETTIIAITLVDLLRRITVKRLLVREDIEGDVVSVQLKGDMLFAPIGEGKPKRVQGCFVSDPEVEAVATYVKSHFITEYDQQVMEEIERKAVQTGNGKVTASDPEPNADELDGDEMLPAAVDVILETGQASVSMLQRRLKLGYARAARIVDEMEEKGIVGPFQGSKPREILVTKEQWAAIRSGGTTQMDFEDLEMADTAVPEDF